MTSLARAISSAAGSRSNLVATALVLLLVAGLFFIPEVVDFQRALGGVGRGDSAEISRQRTEVEAVPSTVEGSVPQVASGTSLAELAEMVERGYIDQVRDEALARRVAASGVRPLIAPGATQTEIRAAEVFSRRPLGWNDIKDQDASGYLHQARGRSVELLRSTGDATPQTKLALTNFISGLQFVLQGGDGIMEPVAALKWLEGLDNSVTKAMVAEGVERATYMQWRGISIGLALQGSRAVRLKQQYYIPFNPKLNLTWVRMQKFGDGTGRFIDDNGPVRLDMVGFVTGRDIEKMELYLNGQSMGPMLLSNPDQHGRRRFSYYLGDGRLTYTFRIIDKYGESYERSYQFYPRVRRFAWNKGSWILPVAKDFEDPTVDRIFRSYGGRPGGPSNRIYEVF